MNEDEVLEHVRRRLPDYRPTGAPPERLPGGHRNHVFRVAAEPAPVIVKHAPPHVASAPGIPLDPSRAGFEARALAALGEGGRLAAASGPAVRAPALLDHDEASATLLLEDIGDLPDLAAAIAAGAAGDATATALGCFVAAIHRDSHGDAELAERFDDAPAQRACHAVPYEGARAMAERAGLADAAALGARAVALGERLQRPGVCLVMGDLWPPSVRIAAGGALRVIDWELAHFGSPAQDVGHLGAHLWMHAHRAAGPAQAVPFMVAWRAFIAGYAAVLGEPARRALWTDERRADAAVHWGCEILVRAAGPLQTGSLYDGLAPDDAFVREAATVAAEMIREPLACSALAPLAE